MNNFMTTWITKEKRSTGMSKGNWFWHNRFMSWFEGKLLTFTNWFWRKRHEAPQQPSPSQEKAPSKPRARKTPAKKVAKKTNWNVKE